MGRFGRCQVRSSRSLPLEMPNHFVLAHLVQSPMHTWGQPLELLESQGIISKQTEPTDWCAPIVVARKKNSNRIRLCVDFSPLNRFVKRERFQSTPPAIAVADIAEHKAKYFTVLDALKGYHQFPLDKDSQLLTTFITPFGRYKFMRAPFGLSSISEHYDRRMYEAFQDLPDFRHIVDDVLIFDEDLDSHIAHVHQFLQRCEERGISLGRDKFQYCQTEVEFAGFHLSQNGYRISEDVTKAIGSFPTHLAELTSAPFLVWSINWLAALIVSAWRSLLSGRSSAPRVISYSYGFPSQGQRNADNCSNSGFL